MMNGREDEHKATIETKADESVPIETATDDPKVLSRRRVLRGAAVAAPVVLTLANRPALASGGGYHCSVSGMGSVSTRASSRYSGCYGCGPSVWRNHKDDWFVHHGNKFKSLFGNIIYYFCWPSGGHSDDTIGMCCDAGDNVFHAECVAALLNSLHYSVYEIGDVKSYIEGLIGSGWTKWQIKNHLKDLRGTPSY